MNILAFNDSGVDFENLIPEYKIVRISSDSEIDYKKLDFSIITVEIKSQADIETVRNLRLISLLNPIPIICLINRDVESLKKDVLKLGAHDYFLLPVDKDELNYKLNSIVKRSGWACKSLLKTVIPNFFKESPKFNLTNREKDILFQVSLGLSNFEISKKYCLSEMTVKTHLKNIFKKLRRHFGAFFIIFQQFNKQK
jgi:DNA-binding NarL/FixJ family response regulator